MRQTPAIKKKIKKKTAYFLFGDKCIQNELNQYTISCFLTPAEIPISILLTVRLILAQSTNVAVMIVCFN